MPKTVRRDSTKTFDPLYTAMVAARAAHDVAEANEMKVAEDNALDSPAYLAAAQHREDTFAVWQAARDTFEAAQPYDPLNDFNYVGSRHHY